MAQSEMAQYGDDVRRIGLWSVILSSALGCWIAQASPPPPTVPALEGTFIQLSVDQRWTDARLNELFLDFQRLGLSRVVIQWAVAGTNAFYPSSAFESVSDPPLERILTRADEVGLRVRVGLAHDPEFWSHITPESRADRVETYLRGLRRRSLTAARELAPIVSKHRSFEGWFLTEEVDDVNWLVPERRALLRSYLHDLGEALHTVGPRASVAVSGFSNAHCDPSTLEAFWKALLEGTKIDVVLFQDGIGTHKLDLPYVPLYLAAMKRAVTGDGRALSIIVELFDQVEGPPLTNAPFKAVPAGVDRLARQLALAGDASTAGTLGFSVPDYMVPSAGTRAQQLFNDYVKRFPAVSRTGRPPGPAAGR